MTKRHIDVFLEELQKTENFHRHYQRGDNKKAKIQRNQETRVWNLERYAYPETRGKMGECRWPQ